MICIIYWAAIPSFQGLASWCYRRLCMWLTLVIHSLYSQSLRFCFKMRLIVNTAEERTTLDFKEKLLIDPNSWMKVYRTTERDWQEPVHPAQHQFVSFKSCIAILLGNERCMSRRHCMCAWNSHTMNKNVTLKKNMQCLIFRGHPLACLRERAHYLKSLREDTDWERDRWLDGW